jgi:hypothetical protein
LRGISIGGLFFYLEDRSTIYRVQLLEYSFVGIPANPDALLEKRKLSLREFANLIHTTQAADELENIAALADSGELVEDRAKARAMKMLNLKSIGIPAQPTHNNSQQNQMTIGSKLIIRR